MLLSCILNFEAAAQTYRDPIQNYRGPFRPPAVAPEGPTPADQDPELATDPRLVPRSTPTWQVVPRISVDLSFTDNARQDPPGDEKSDFYITVTPGVAVNHLGPRLTFNFDYAVSRVQFFKYDSESEFNHNLLSTGTLEILNESLFLDARFAVQQVLLSSGGSISAGENTSSNERTVASGLLSPYWRYRLGRWADSELRYTFSHVNFLEGGQQDSTSHRISETLSAGSEFSRYLWSLNLAASQTNFSSGSSRSSSNDDDEDDENTGRSRNTNSQLALLSNEYVVNQYISALANLGYERIHDRTLDDDPNGFIWAVGFALRPGPRTSMRLLYGDRYNRDYWQGNFSYLFGPRSRFEASYTQSLTTSQNLASENLSYLGTDEFGNLIDQRTARRLQVSNSSFNVNSNAFRQDRFQARLDTELARTTFRFLAFHESRETDASDRNQKVMGAAIDIGRALNPYTSVNATLRYTNTKYDDDDNRKDNVYSGSVSLNHRITETLTGIMSYTYLNRDSNESDSDLRENLFTVGLRKTF